MQAPGTDRETAEPLRGTDEPLVLREREGALVTLTLNRPKARNAVDAALREDLLSELHTIAVDDTIRVVILTGRGKAFCGGGDIRGMSERMAVPAGQIAVKGVRRQRRTAEFVRTLHHLPQIVIAALNGPAAGLGYDLALACDFIVAAPEAWVAASFVDRGLIPDGGSMYFLPRRVGMARAKDFLLSGRRVDATEALELGLVDEVAEDGALAGARAVAARYVDKSATSLLLAKDIINRSFELSLEEVAHLGGQAQGICNTTEEHRASVEAFLARRGSR